MFRGSAVGLRRKFVLIGGFPVRLMHGFSSWGSVGNSPLTCTKRTNRPQSSNAYVILTAAVGGANPF
jgi:hypothetical protein